MSDHVNTEENATGFSSENIEGEVSEIQTFHQRFNSWIWMVGQNEALCLTFP